MGAPRVTVPKAAAVTPRVLASRAVRFPTATIHTYRVAVPTGAAGRGKAADFVDELHHTTTGFPSGSASSVRMTFLRHDGARELRATYLVPDRQRKTDLGRAVAPADEDFRAVSIPGQTIADAKVATSGRVSPGESIRAADRKFLKMTEGTVSADQLTRTRHDFKKQGQEQEHSYRHVLAKGEQPQR